MNKTAIIASTDRGVHLALAIQKEFASAIVVSTRMHEHSTYIHSIAHFLEDNFSKFDAFIFIGALGICVRSIAPYLKDKQCDPAVVNMDDMGKYVQAVLSGHIGGANELSKKIAGAIGAQAIITSSSDLQELWALDTLDKKFHWKVKTNKSMNAIIALFVNNKATALLLDVNDEGTRYLEAHLPAFAKVYYHFNEIDFSRYELFIAVTYRVYEVPPAVASIIYHPPVLSVGMGCSRGIEADLLEASLRNEFSMHQLAVESVKAIASIDIKQDEDAFISLTNTFKIPLITYTADQLNTQVVQNPSEVVLSKLGVYSVSEAAAMLSSGNKKLLSEKKKITLASGKKHTLAIALEEKVQRAAMVAIVGAGPGDPDLISLKGRWLIQQADLILYAGSLVPVELTLEAKPGAIVRNSASMTLEEQMQLMEEHYAKGHLIVRLQSGDPSIYGAIQEQMSLFDEKGMNYFIVPGISSFQAAAAHLKSEFTIPEVVQSIILTRGAGKTPLPEHEKLNEMARHKATMCIFLSATIAKSVQEQLLEHYEPETPVAVLYRVTWKDEQVYTGQLKDLATIIRDHKLTLTTLVIVGTAIGARKNRSHLYNPAWKHTFRTGKKIGIAHSTLEK
jgi:precorrin-4 C11-methyltransferase